MANTLFILGAGASYEAGGPLMTTFLDVAEQLLNTGRVGENQSDFSLVFKGLDLLQRVQAKAYLEANNLEEAFAAFEMIPLLGGLPELSNDEMDQLPNAMRNVIARTLESSIRFPISGGEVRPPAPYAEFAGLVSDMVINRKHSVSVISFNYDVALDFAFHYIGQPANLRIDPSYRGNDVNILKLHGSLLWVRCSSCNAISNCLQAFHQMLTSRMTDGFVSLNITDSMRNMCCRNCSHPISEPLIVPPTWNKSQYHSLLSPVWHAAKAALQQAENIVVVGYSLPSSDHFFRHLYALGTMGPTRIKNFWVFDPDRTQEFRQRYEQLLGPLAKNRFAHHQLEFGKAVAKIRELLEIKTVAVSTR
jgi:hypothetical protein